jgi:hypothetical protein
MKQIQLAAPLAIFFLLAVLPRCLHSQATIQTLLNNGATADRINIVMFSEGYTSQQLSQYLTDASTLLNKLIEAQPFKEYSSYFNAFAIAVASKESGSDHPSRNFFRDTFFNSTYDSFDIQRLVTISGAGRARVDSLLQLLMPEYDVVLMIVNDPEYGGSGGFPAITSVNASAPELVVHELGHSFAGLGDEYSTPFPGYPDIEEPNTTQETRRDFIKWRAWILNSTPFPTPPLSPQYAAVVGLFEGAHYHDTGWFRPKLDCKMRVLGVDFCEVCAEALVKSKYELIAPIESFSPAATNIFLAGSESVSLGIVPLQPATHALSIQWRVNGTAVNGATSPSFLVSAPALGNGTHQVKVKVVDNTGMVRNDPARLLSDSTTWTIYVSNVTTVAEAPQPQMPRQYWLEQNYPNPLSTSALNSATTIRYALPRATHVKLTVYNVGGQPVAELVNAEKQPGVHQVRLEIERLANGIYFYRLQAEGFIQTKKFIFLK